MTYLTTLNRAEPLDVLHARAADVRKASQPTRADRSRRTQGDRDDNPQQHSKNDGYATECRIGRITLLAGAHALTFRRPA